MSNTTGKSPGYHNHTWRSAGNPDIVHADELLQSCVIADVTIETDVFDYQVLYELAKASLDRYRDDYDILPKEVQPTFEKYVRFRLFDNPSSK